MNEYVSKDIVVKNVLDQMLHSKSLIAMRERIMNLKSANVAERKRGKWLLKQEYSIYEGDGEKFWECSLCGCGSDSYDTTFHTNFCPNCGAIMRGDNDDD